MIKKFLILIFGLFLINNTFSADNLVNQGFKIFNQDGKNFNFQCEKQCFVIMGEKGRSNYINLNGNIKGQGSVGYGFLNGQQIVPGELYKVEGNEKLNKDFLMEKLQFYSQLNEKVTLVLIMDGNLFSDGLNISLEKTNFVQNLKNGFNQALEFREYNPRTINFLEGPMWNGKYLNQEFLLLIIILLFLALLLYFIFDSKQEKNKSFYFGLGVLCFFWIFFDFFSTINSVKMNSKVTNTNIMSNGRLGVNSDYYLFLDYIKTIVPDGEKGFFLSPYPFDFEGKYHIYPNVKFDKIDKVKYIFWYNPFGKDNGFNFVDPTFSSGTLIWNDKKFDVEKEIKWKDYAKIYIIK